MSFADKIESLFGFHTVTTEGADATAPKHETLRDKFTDLAKALDEIVPDGALKDKVITDLKTVSMWANQAIAETAPLVTTIEAELKPTPVDEPAQLHESTPPAATDAGAL